MLTQARLDMLALNQNRNSSRALESHVQALTDQYHHFSEDLDHLKDSMTQEMEGLRLEMKNVCGPTSMPDIPQCKITNNTPNVLLTIYQSMNYN